MAVFCKEGDQSTINWLSSRKINLLRYRMWSDFPVSLHLKRCSRFKQERLLFMDDHISTQRMEAFCARTLSKEEFVAAAGHLANCEICLDTFREVFRKRRDYAPFILDLSLEEWFKDDHLEDERLI